jgi:16S rRNA U516 pseudouridylate synthase RsuA-like enzyme
MSRLTITYHKPRGPITKRTDALRKKVIAQLCKENGRERPVFRIPAKTRKIS